MQIQIQIQPPLQIPDAETNTNTETNTETNTDTVSEKMMTIAFRAWVGICSVCPAVSLHHVARWVGGGGREERNLVLTGKKIWPGSGAKKKTDGWDRPRCGCRQQVGARWRRRVTMRRIECKNEMDARGVFVIVLSCVIWYACWLDCNHFTFFFFFFLSLWLTFTFFG